MTTAIASRLRRESLHAGAMHELLAPCAFFGDAVLTKRGDLFTVLRLTGIDAECLEPDAIAQICRRFESTLSPLGPEYRLYQYLFKHDHPALPQPLDPDQLSRSRLQWLDDRKAALYRIDTFLVILRTPSMERSITRGLVSRFSIRNTLQLSQLMLKRESEALATAAHNVCVQLRELLCPQIIVSSGINLFL